MSLETQFPAADAAMASDGDTEPKPDPDPIISSRKKPSAAVQLISHLPVARTEALASFNEISENWYQYKTLGKVRELEESMMCDCTFDPQVDHPSAACGHQSDCINRLTQIECLAGYCRCKSYCQNQRFQKKQYAPIEIVQTEMKGYGLRAEEDLEKDTFIYEYVGDVVSNSSFKKRMRDYANEGIQHFYFMMLQKDEFIDATKSGGKGRFANHSCNPNCYVAKWTINQHVRMGIFAKRKIWRGEELTFNYNVDRYGHQAQTCYCGEPNCVGFIGGKTQTETDISALDELYLDALGLTDPSEIISLKGTKKKRGKKFDDEDFMPMSSMKPLSEKDVPKVVQAIRQTQSRKMLIKLLGRIKLTEDLPALRQVMRLRGFSLMKNILEDYGNIKDGHAVANGDGDRDSKEDIKDVDLEGQESQGGDWDVEIITLVLECMFSWPLIHRNKVEDSQVFVPVKQCVKSGSEGVKMMAQKLLTHWDSLETAYRIPKVLKPIDEIKPDPDGDLSGEPATTLETTSTPTDDFTTLDSNFKEPKWFPRVPPIPRAPPMKLKEVTPPEGPSARELFMMNREKQKVEQKKGLEAIIAAAARKAEQEKEEKEAEERKRAEREEERRIKREQRAKEGKGEGTSNGKKRLRDKDKERDKEKRRREKGEKRKEGEKGEKDSDKEAWKEKRLLKLISPVVVKSMSKHASAIGHERFKKHAKELTEKIAEREKKSSAYLENKLDSLSEEKAAKIKKYAKEYIDKLVRRVDASGKHGRGEGRKPSSSAIGLGLGLGLTSSSSISSGLPGSPANAVASPMASGSGSGSGLRGSPSSYSPTPTPTPALGSTPALGGSTSSAIGTPTSPALQADMASVALDDGIDVEADMEVDSESDEDADANEDEDEDDDMANGRGDEEIERGGEDADGGTDTAMTDPRDRDRDKELAAKSDPNLPYSHSNIRIQDSDVEMGGVQLPNGLNSTVGRRK